MIQCLRLTVLGCSHAAREAAAEHLSTNPSVTQMNGAPQWPLVCAGTHFESPRQDRQAPSDWVAMTRSCLTSHMVLQTGSRATFVTQTLRVSFGNSGNTGLEACHTDFEVSSGSTMLCRGLCLASPRAMLVTHSWPHRFRGIGRTRLHDSLGLEDIIWLDDKEWMD